MIYNYKIYQISLERQGAEQLALRPYTPCEDKPDAVSSGAYDLVYSGTLTCEPNWSTSRILERLFRVLNMEHPADYKARSLSVSDVVSLPGDEGERLYYCDVFGFREVTFTPKSEM